MLYWVKEQMIIKDQGTPIKKQSTIIYPWVMPLFLETLQFWEFHLPIVFNPTSMNEIPSQ